MSKEVWTRAAHAKKQSSAIQGKGEGVMFEPVLVARVSNGAVCIIQFPGFSVQCSELLV